MKKIIFSLAILLLLGTGLAAAQGVAHGNGAPSALHCDNPFYIDDSSATLYEAGLSGRAKCVWTRAVDPLCVSDGAGHLTCNTLTTTAAPYALGTCTTAATITPANGIWQQVTLTDGDACALTFTQPTAGTAHINLAVTQSAAGAFKGTITGCLWPGGTVPAITQTSGAVDIITVELDGINSYCSIKQAFN